MLFLCFSLSGLCRHGHAADAIPGEQWCDRTINAIEFRGNRVTRDQVLRRELVQRTGDPCSLDDVIDGIQNIMDLGLFKVVRAELELDDQQLTLQYIVAEKIFFLPIPRISRTSDGELRLGAQLRWDNFQGRLHQLRLTSEKRQENDGRGKAGYVHSVDYSVPRFFGSRYGMSVRATVERVDTDLVQDDVRYGQALRESQRAGIRLARWASNTQGVGGFSYSLGVGIEHRDYKLRSGVAGPFSDGRDIAVSAGFSLQRVHQETYRRRGVYYGATLVLADPALGSDFRYTRLDVEARWYLPVAAAQTNLNIQARLGISNRAPFGEQSYEIGGGELIRGMQSGEHAGDVLTLVNIEYLSGLFAYPAWRWLVFVDVGNVYPEHAVDLLQLHVRTGIGLRWKLEAFTNTDIRLDLAWDPEKNRVKPYVSTSLTF